MPTVSVIIPVYKVERYLDACVESVIGQTYTDLEILLIDDGSPDCCPAMCGQKRTPASWSYTAKTEVFPLRATPALRRQAANF